jgi:hypothetical protein
MGRGAATRGPRQREERGSGAGKHAQALPPRATGGQHPGQAVESRIMHETPPRLVCAKAAECAACGAGLAVATPAPESA